MKFDVLLTYDKSLVIEKELDCPRINGAADYHHTSQGFLTFFKEKRYWRRFTDRTDEREFIFCFSEALWNEFSEEERSELKQKSQGILTAGDFDMTLVRLSRPFYEQKFSSIQSEVDGRQFENCKIDPTARIAQQVFLGEHVTIGRDVIIHPGTRIMAILKLMMGAKSFQMLLFIHLLRLVSGCVFMETRR